MIIIKQVRRLVLLLADILFPVECLGCGRAGDYLCLKCLRAISWRSVQVCPKCLRPNLWGEYCDECYSFLDGVVVVSTYQDELLKQAIKAYKYRFARAIAQPLANLIIMFLGRFLAPWSVLKKKKVLPKALECFDKALVMPVPLSQQRQAWRGFNQSELLARAMADFFGQTISLDLKRLKQTKPQAGLSKKERLKNVQGCFVWQGSNLEGQNVILLDDLTTTGATLLECAKVLKQHGANEVWGLVLAKN